MKQEINKESVYLLRYVGRKEVKIGMSRSLDPRKRISDYNMYSIHGVEVLGVVQCLDSLDIERKIHKEFNHKRIKGEWFDLTKEDVEYIINKYSSLEYKEAYKDFLNKYIDKINIDEIDRDILNLVPAELILWFKYNIILNERFSKKDLYSSFIEYSKFRDLKKTVFNKWLVYYSKHKNIEYSEGRTATDRYIIFKTRL